MIKPVTLFSEGCKLSGDLYVPDDLEAGERRAGVLLCHGYTGVKDLYLPDNARALTQAGYVAMTFDYKGWGASEGPRARLDPYGRVADAQAALTFLAMQADVDEARLGILGVSYGGGTVVWLAAIDHPCQMCGQRRRCRPWRAMDAQRATPRRMARPPGAEPSRPASAGRPPAPRRWSIETWSSRPIASRKS